MKKQSTLSLKEICEDCGAKCCKQLGSPIVFPKEKRRIEQYLKERNIPDHFQERPGGYHVIPTTVCPYLENNHCQIQDGKPLDCRNYPVSFNQRGEIGISASCPAKNLLSPEFLRDAKKSLRSLGEQEQRTMSECPEMQCFDFTKSPSPFGLELLIDLYGCSKQILESEEQLRKYNRDIVKVIDMTPVGDTIIPEKFGEGTLYGFSSMQFIQTSSIVLHLCENMLEAHIDIFSCKPFDAEKATKFSEDFFKARKSRTRLIER